MYESYMHFFLKKCIMCLSQFLRIIFIKDKLMHREFLLKNVWESLYYSRVLSMLISWFFLLFFKWSSSSLSLTDSARALWIHWTLDKSWIAYLDLREHHRLVTHGPYHWVRHPMYTQTIMFLVSLSLISSNLLMMLASGIVIILILHRIPREERMMIQRFGIEYKEYMRKTGRLLPRLKRNTKLASRYY